MSESFDSIKRGFTEAVRYSAGKRVQAIVHESAPIDVKNTRATLKISQVECGGKKAKGGAGCACAVSRCKSKLARETFL